MPTPTPMTGPCVQEQIIDADMVFSNYNTATGEHELKGWKRTKTITTNRYVFQTVADGSAFIEAWKTSHPDSASRNSDAVSRRANDHGWGEVILVEVEYGDWEEIQMQQAN